MTDEETTPNDAAADPAAATGPTQPADTAPPAGDAADVPPPPPGADGADPLTAAREQAAEYLQLAQRKQAEFENFRKRMQGQAAGSEARGIARVAKELLAPLDHLALAVEHAADEDARQPLESLRTEFLAALGRAGVEAFDPVGEPFDPTVHEAMTQQPVEGAESGTVVSTYQSGYKIGDTVIRAARVVVAA